MLTLLPGARRRALLAAALVLVGSTAVQLSAALAAGTFADLGTLAVSGYRMTAAAVVLLLLTRPRLRGRDRRTWAAIVLYGIAMAAMNVLFYAALDRLPLGVAVTLEFCGPLLIAAVASAGRARVLPFVALLGVLLVVGGPAGGVDPLGVLLGLGAAAAFGAYTLLAGRVGDASTGLGDLALSVGVGAVLLAPRRSPRRPTSRPATCRRSSRRGCSASRWRSPSTSRPSGSPAPAWWGRCSPSTPRWARSSARCCSATG